MIKRILKIFYKSLTVIIAALAVLLCIYCIYVVVQRARGEELPFVFGYAAATVQTGSMEPEISAGDLIIIKSCSDYYEGDVITFYDGSFGGYITHRIISIQDGLYITQGDANTAADSGITYDSIKGKVVLTIGGAGTVIEFLQTPAGIMCIIGAAAALWAIVKIVSIVVKKCRRKESKE